MSMIRLLFASDFHGSDACFRKFISAGLNYEAQVLIVGGDVTGKAIVPLKRSEGDTYEGYLFGQRYVVSTEEERTKLKKTIARVGFYPLEVEREEAKELESDPQKLDQIFLKLMKETVARWMELAEEHLAPKGIKLYFLPGNDDTFAIDEVIEASGFVVNPDEKRVWIDDYHEMIGLSCSNMTPWNCPRDITEEELAAKIEKLVVLLKDQERAIFAFHCPPHDSGLDVCPELDENLEIKYAGGQVIMKPVGSTSIWEAIQKVQPLLGLHGHIHEAPGFRKIGRTLCVNPGSEYAEGILRAVLINLESDRVKGYMPISG